MKWRYGDLKFSNKSGSINESKQTSKSHKYLDLGKSWIRSFNLDVKLYTLNKSIQCVHILVVKLRYV